MNRSSLAVIFIPFFSSFLRLINIYLRYILPSLAKYHINDYKEGDTMATAKYKRGKDGYFQAKVWDGTYLENGKKHYVPLRSKKSSKDLEQKVQEYNENVRNRKNIRRSDVTFIEYSTRWLELFKGQKENNTKAMYKNIIEKHFTVLETTKLQEIDRIHLQLLLGHAAGKLRTQQQIQMTFKQVLGSAVIDRLYPANVYETICQNMDKIDYTPAPKRPLTASEKKAIFQTDYKYEQDKIFVYLLYGCGLRREEALALTIFDFNFGRHTVSINKAYEYTKNSPGQKGTKSSNGIRELPIPSKVLSDVENYVNHVRKCGRTNIFTMRGGKPVSKSSYDKMWARILKCLQSVSEEQITGLTAHVFRHNYCTELCYQIPTISIKRIAQLLGDSERMVLEVYNHIILEKEDADKAVNNALNF